MSQIQPTRSTPPETRPARGRNQLTSEGWLLLAAGIGLVGWGIWKVVEVKSPIYGPGAIGLGLTLMPWRVVGLIGGAGLVLLGAYRFYEGFGMQAGLLILLGVLGIAERMRRN